MHRAVRYALRHEDADGPIAELFSVDQSADQEWVDLGEWDFAAGVGQHLSVYDNVEEPVGDDQHIAVDAVRSAARTTVAAWSGRWVRRWARLTPRGWRSPVSASSSADAGGV